MRIGFHAVLLATALMVPGAAVAGSPVEEVNRNSDGIAVHGYDVVAYFKDSKPVKGLATFEYAWMGTKWRFGSQENRDAFAASPAKYAPQFGGYCAWAVGHNYTADTDPEAWRIVDGKLYLNYNLSIQKKWELDRSKWIDEGHRNWPGLHK